MDRRPSTIPTVGAFLVAVIAVVLAGLISDPTPLLVEPSPDLDWPLGVLGIAGGLWSASRITALPYARDRRLGRVALWIMLPLTLAFGLMALGDRTHETLSFGRDASTEEATVLVTEKSSGSSRSGRVFHEVGVVSPVDERVITLRVDEPTYERIKPNRECVTLLVERAPNGAARLLKPLRWQVRCPRTSR